MRIHAIGYLKHFIGIASVAAAMTSAMPTTVSGRPQQAEQDVFTYVQKVPTTGTDDRLVLANAPSPAVVVAGEKKNAAIVVDLEQNILYHYDEKGKAVEAFLVASGKKSSPTTKGVRAVTHVETYPYKGAPARSKRRRNPNAYGPKIICLETVDVKTGARGITGEFIHGNNNPKSLGHYASLGCIRMDNEVIKHLAKQVKRGHFVLIK